MKRLAIIVAIALASLSCVASHIQRDPISRETAVRQSRPKLEAERFDPQEEDPILADVFLVADMKAERAVGNVPRDSRFVFRFWEVKKKILKREFNVEWQSPAELNPDIAYGTYGQPLITEGEHAKIVSLVSQETVSPDEEVIGAWRTYEGLVFVATRESESGDVRHYELHGCEETWNVVAVHSVLYEYPGGK